MAYRDSKDLARRAALNKVLRPFNIAKNAKYDGYQRGLDSMIYKFFDKNSKGSGANNEGKNSKNSKNSNLDDSGISLPVFPSRTNLKLHNISITPKMVKKVIMNFDLSKASGPDCIPVVVLKNCEPEFSYILAEHFNKCLKESCFPDCGKVSLVVSAIKSIGERSTAKNYRPVSLLSVVSKIFEKL